MQCVVWLQSQSRKITKTITFDLTELTEESDRSATVSEAEEERKSKERKRRKSMSVRSARQPNDKESESYNQQLHIEQQVREESEQQQARRGSTSVAYPETLQQALKLLSTQDW